MPGDARGRAWACPLCRESALPAATGRPVGVYASRANLTVHVTRHHRLGVAEAFDVVGRAEAVPHVWLTCQVPGCKSPARRWFAPNALASHVRRAHAPELPALPEPVDEVERQVRVFRSGRSGAARP